MLGVIGLINPVEPFGETAYTPGWSPERGEKQQNCERHRAEARET